MEEHEYRSRYNELASVRCVFEKTLTNHQGECALAVHFCLADREGYSCKKAEYSLKCHETLEILRKKSVFVLKLQEIKGPLPHNMEIRVQAGGLLGIAKLLSDNITGDSDDKNKKVFDISQIITQVEQKYGNIDSLPFNEIVQSVVQSKGRQRRRRDK